MDDEPGNVNGGPSNLPVGNVSEPEAIAHALTMPGVIETISVAESRGYLRVPEEDRANFPNDGSSKATQVFLALEKPGIVEPQDYIGAPVVLVSTVVGPGFSEQTKISCALFLGNTVDGSLTTADEFPTMFPDDYSFDANPASDPGGNPTEPYTMESASNSLLRCGVRWAGCHYGGNTACVGAGIGTFLASGKKAAAIVVGLTCIGGNSFNCATQFVTCN